MRFQNKVILVTGGSSGIGAATALLFAKEGAKVAIVGRNQTKLQTVEESSKKEGNQVFVINGDVTKEDNTRRIMELTLNKFGKLDILVNSAGIMRPGTFLDGRMFETYDDVMNTNVRAVVYLMNLAVPHLMKTKGNIINISSVSGKVVRGMSFYAYCASKAALDIFSRAAALELGAYGIRVNIVSPGPVITDMYTNAKMNIDLKVGESATVLKRVSTSDEVAKLIAFLASDDAIGVTGADYLLDNGLCLI